MPVTQEAFQILVNAVPLRNLATGISRYLRNLYVAMETLEDVQPAYFTSRTTSRCMPEATPPAQWIRTNSLLWKLPERVVFGLRALSWHYYEGRLRRQVKTNNYDVYHETSFVPAKLARVPQVHSIFDLSLIRYRATHPRERVMFFDAFFHRWLPRVDHVLTISNFIREEIMEHFGLPEDRVSSVHLAPDPVFSPRSKEQIKDALNRLELPSEYLLFVGSLEPRKNLDCLVRALSLTRYDGPAVLAGWEGWGQKAWHEEIVRRGLEERVFLAGYVDDENLARLYSGALAFVYPSLYEGFGLPLLEAMACGCPVVSAAAASMPEVGGDAVLYFDPHSPEELAARIDMVAGDRDLARGLATKGIERQSLFTWRRTARQTLGVFRKAAGK